MILRRKSWQIRLLEMGLPYSGRLQQSQRWKLFLTSKSETQEPLSLSVLYGSVHSHIPSSSNQ